MIKTIALTGGGTAGHVMPNIALLTELKKHFENIYYIGEDGGIEQELIAKEKIKFFPIKACKLKRQFCMENFKIPFTLIKSVRTCKNILLEIKPNVVFSKGGYVSLPVCLACKKLKIPYFVHESDMTVGLTNKLCVKSAKKVFTTFRPTAQKLKNAVCTGAILRKEFFNSKNTEPQTKLQLIENKPTILVMGGSLGSVKINNALSGALSVIAEKFNIIHIAGRNSEQEFFGQGYNYFKFYDKIWELINACDMVVSRAGANSVSEFLALKKPMLLIPLSKRASRGDQIVNARYFEKCGFAKILPEEELTPAKLVDAVTSTFNERSKIKAEMNKFKTENSVKTICSYLCKE